MDELIHVACNIDSKYTRYCGVLMTSLFENNKSETIKMHILCYHLAQQDKHDLEEIVNGYNNLIEFYDVDESLFVGFPISDKWPIVIYFRLLLPTLVSEDIEKILYVDCDIIFRGPIRELINIDLCGNIIGAVEDVLSPYVPIIEGLEYNPQYYYFNSGVLLIDLKRWQQNDISLKCMDFIKKHDVFHPDQDALNAILYDKWERILYRWNYLSSFHNCYIRESFFWLDFNCQSKNYPIIIHFTGIKPWDSKCRDPFKCNYFYYQNLTKWGKCIPKHSLKEWIVHSLICLLDQLNIKKKSPYYKFN